MILNCCLPVGFLQLVCRSSLWNAKDFIVPRVVTFLRGATEHGDGGANRRRTEIPRLGKLMKTWRDRISDREMKTAAGSSRQNRNRRIADSEIKAKDQGLADEDNGLGYRKRQRRQIRVSKQKTGRQERWQYGIWDRSRSLVAAEMEKKKLGFRSEQHRWELAMAEKERNREKERKEESIILSTDYNQDRGMDYNRNKVTKHSWAHSPRRWDPSGASTRSARAFNQQRQPIE